MMKTRLIPTLSLLALLLASCASAAVTEASSQQPAAPVAVEPGATSLPDTAQAPSDQTLKVAPTEAAVSDPLPVATSRGADLEATDPRTVNLASGQLQFVEFFRFT
jgi:PBP1b-binding outer membrane lipoprotein LpoB